MRKFNLIFLIFMLTAFGFQQSFAQQQWQELTKIIAPDRNSSDYFGYSVAIDGNYAVVGANEQRFDENGENSWSGAGAAYIFKKENDTWVFQQKIVASDRIEGEFYTFPAYFGESVDISGDYIVVGAYYKDGGWNSWWEPVFPGAAYVFKREGDIWVEHQKLTPTLTGRDIWFGKSVAIDGEYILVGAAADSYGETQQNPVPYAGSAYIFKLEEDSWLQKQKIVAPFRGASDNFGYAVALESDYAVIGAYREDEDADEEFSMADAGSAYIFKKESETWVLQQKIVAADRAAEDYFGASVAISGNYVVVGAYQEDEDANGENLLNNAGSVYIFKKEGDSWTQEQKIVSSDRRASDFFGFDVSIDGDRIAVGAYGQDWDVNNGNSLSMAGAAYIFKREENNWFQQQKIVASDREVNDMFGWSVSLGSGSAIIGAYQEDHDINGENGENNSGSAYIFDQMCLEVELTVETPTPEAICSGGTTTLIAGPEDYIINWYDSADAAEPIFTGLEFTTPVLTETTSYWVEAVFDPCVSERQEVTVAITPAPVLTVENSSVETCEGTSTLLTAISEEGAIINWYDSEDATEPVFTGSGFQTPQLTETTSYWVDAIGDCTTERTEVTVTIIPAPELTIEIPEPSVCYGSAAELFATSEGNVIFWYENEHDEEYLYHGNLFITETLTETTTFWVEAYNILTGCFSERIEITVTVNPIPDAPIAVSYQTVEEGTTLADLEVDAEGTLTWYADEALTVVLPDTTLIEENTIYYVTQTIAGCKSEAIEISVGFLGLTDVNGQDFTIYPNPTNGIIKIQSKTAVANIEVFNINGQTVTSVKGVNEVNISGYTTGTYVLRITLENGDVLTKKVIKR